MKEKIFPITLLLAVILFSFPACSSGDDRNEEVFEIIEKNDSDPSNSEGGDQNSGDTDSGDSDTDSLDTGYIINDGSNDTHAPKYFKMEPYFRLVANGGGQQGAALYGDFLFHATANSEIHIYNMKEKKHITTLKLGTMGHADTMCFGIQKVEENDEFPVLYVSGSNSNTSGKGGHIYVYRLTQSTDEGGNEKWEGSLVQHIVTPNISIIGSFPDVVIDTDKKNMWIMGWLSPDGYDTEEGANCTNCFSKYNIPDIRDGKLDNNGVYQLTLSDEERLSYFLVYDIHAITQGICFYNGKIICPYGMPSRPFKGVDVVDIEKEKITQNVNLKGASIYEAEAAVMYEKNLYILGQREYVYKCSGLDL